MSEESMRIIIEVIPHEKQRYPTVGDWIWDDNGNLTIKISSMKNWKYEICVAIHELIEVMLCRNKGITQDEVDKFDIMFEAKRQPGDTSEPGDNPDAPYRQEHFFATSLERLIAQQLNIDWSEYEEAINSL